MVMNKGQTPRRGKAKAALGANCPVPPGAGPHPNELDLRRIERLLERRLRYRYVSPEVRPVNGGYLVVSPCCSRNIDPSGGTIDIAWLEYAQSEGVWRLYYKDHERGVWKLYSVSPALQALMANLNEDPYRVFWQ